MERPWLARPYRFADGIPWDEFRYEIFVPRDKQLISVGGAIRIFGKQPHYIAFICTKAKNRKIRTPQDAMKLSDGNYVKGRNMKEALTNLKQRFPQPDVLLDQQDATF